MGTALLREQETLENATESRAEVIARYTRLRQISKWHHSKVLQFLAHDSVLQQARRLGLASGRTITVESEDEMTLIFDLAIYTAPAGRSRAIDRYARSVPFPKGSEEAAMLEGMCAARFAVMVVQDRHPSAGLLVTDIIRKVDLWLMDSGLERSLKQGGMFATRYFRPADFAMTAGVVIPVDLTLLEEAAAAAIPKLARRSEAQLLEDRRFAEAFYNAAIALGIMEGVRFEDPADDAA